MRIKIKSSFLKSAAILTSGSILAQLITVIAAPILSRYYSPTEIGVYTYVLSVASIFMPIINGRYDMSIVTEEREELIYPLMKLSIVISVIVSIVVTAGYAVYIIYFSNEYKGYLYTAAFMFVLLLTYGFINVLTAYNNRKKEYKIMTSVYMIRTACQNIGAIILGLFRLGLLGLLLPYTIGQLLGINRQAKSLKPRIKDFIKADKTSVIEVLKLHYRQPLYSAPALFANSFAYSSITFFIEALFGMSVLGFYSISVRILGLPLSIISGNISRVFFEEASREFSDTGQFYKTFKNTTVLLVSLAIPMLLLMAFVAPSLISLFFGKSWSNAGVYVKILSIMFGIRFIVTSLSTGLLVARKQNYELILQCMFIVSSILCFIIARIFSFTVIGYLTIINITFSISFITYFIVIYKCSKKRSEGNNVNY